MTRSPFDAMPVTRPEAIAADTFLSPNLAPGPDSLLLPVNSMVIRGREPVIVDTGAPVHRDEVAREGVLGGRARGRALDLPLA